MRGEENGLEREERTLDVMARKKGFNWRARQQISIPSKSKETSSTRRKKDVVDTNFEVLPGKRVSVDKEDHGTTQKKKMSSKERKRLMKVLEVKRKKAQVSVF